MLIQVISQILPFNVLHGNIVTALAFTKIKYLYDILMLQLL